MAWKATRQITFHVLLAPLQLIFYQHGLKKIKELQFEPVTSWSTGRYSKKECSKELNFLYLVISFVLCKKRIYILMFVEFKKHPQNFKNVNYFNNILPNLIFFVNIEISMDYKKCLKYLKSIHELKNIHKY